MSCGETLPSTLSKEVLISSVRKMREEGEREERARGDPLKAIPDFVMSALEKMSRSEERKEKQKSRLSSDSFAFLAVSVAKRTAAAMVEEERREERISSASFFPSGLSAPREGGIK